MSRMSEIYLRREDWKRSLEEALNEPLDIVENPNPLIWIVVTRSGNTIIKNAPIKESEDN